MQKPGYKKNPLTLGVKALVKQAYEMGAVVIEPLAQKFPNATPFLQFTYYSFGAYLAYHQEELNDFTEYLMANYGSGMDFDSREFQEGVLTQLESYFKLRVKDKRLVAQEIFNSFCGSPNKPEFPLERYNDTLMKISVEGLRYLVFLQKQIFPIRDREVMQKYDSGNHPQPPIGKLREWWIDYYTRTEPISQYVGKWLQDVYPATVDISQVESAKEEYRQEEVERKRNSLSDLSLEMEQLGIIYSYNVGGTIGGGGNVYNLSPYGLKFIEFIPRTID
jgi:hypothetical protein